jgi:hypothetical protein
MRSLLITVYSVCLAAGFVAVRADDTAATAKNGTASSSTTTEHNEHKKPAKPALTEEQKKARKELMAKYDANKDGKLDKEERAKITDEDKTRLKKAGLTPKKAGKKSTAQ